MFVFKKCMLQIKTLDIKIHTKVSYVNSCMYQSLYNNTQVSLCHGHTLLGYNNMAVARERKVSLPGKGLVQPINANLVFAKCSLPNEVSPNELRQMKFHKKV